LAYGGGGGGGGRCNVSESNPNLHAVTVGQEEDPQISPTLPRSFTDSNIAYKQDNEVTEVSGSKHYIQDNGHLQYKVVLRALHFVAMNEHSPRICEVLLNLLNCLLDLDIIETRKDLPPATAIPSPAPGTRLGTGRANTVANLTGNLAATPVGSISSAKSPGSGHSGANSTAATPEAVNTSGQENMENIIPGRKDEITAHSLAMDSLFRIYKALGCPHGCNDGVVGSLGDHLRLKGQNCLQRLHKLNPAMFHKFLRDTVKKRPLQESVDFLHAFLGFCFDPTSMVQSPMSQKKSVSQENLPRAGYANNFGHSVGGEGYRGVEGVLIANLVKPLVSRCVECANDLYGNENIGLFCDIRQLMAYVKEIHGGTFRRVALSGLLDSLQKVKRESSERKREIALKKQSSPVRRTTSVTSESGDEKEATPLSTKHINIHQYPRDDDSTGRRKSKKSLFRTKITKSLMFQYTASDSEMLDEGPGKSPRTSISAAEEDSPSSSTTPRRRFSKFNIGWRRGTKSDHEDEQMSDPPPLDRRESRSEMQVHRNIIQAVMAQQSGGAAGAGRGRMSFRAASQATLTFLSARKRIEDGIKILGKKMTRKGSSDDFFKQRSGVKSDSGVELVMVKEKKMVDRYLIKSGMLRFSFLLECCHPGSLPDPQMVAAMLDLEAPVSARAAMLLECAHFIHRCNRGDWPNWMKLNLPSFRHTVAALQNRGQPSGYRRNIILQKAAGRMFYSWAENLGLQMEYILAKEHEDRLAVIDEVKDENRKRELRAEDEEEDFLDEASVNHKGKECPYALKMLACLVLMEVTTFLRETFQYLPRSRSQKREHLWEKNVTSRRYSSIVSSPGHSDKSSESNIGELPSGISTIGSPGDRKISFAVLTERSDSLHSSTGSLSQLEPGSQEEKKEKGRRLAQGRQKLLRHFRRGSGHNLSFRRSFKLGRPESGSGSIRQHGGSIKSRKISSHSLQSDAKFTEEEGVPYAGCEDSESVAMMSDDTNQESPIDKDMELEDEHLYTNLPWIKVVVQLANLSNFICPHHNFCHPNCYERQRRSCSRLTTALRKIYNSTEEDERNSAKGTDGSRSKEASIRDKLKRRESIFQVTSPTTRRRESTPLLEKIKTDVSMTKLKLNSNWKKDDKPKEAKEDPPVVKYLVSQAQRLTQCPMAILTKAAPVLNVEHFIDIMPVAWELMLESDQELAAAAASVFLLSSAKSSDKARNMIIKEMQHEETTQRINAVLRFGALWKFRYQVWPRMEDGANMYFKLPPPSIDFTLPSPCIGLPSLTVVDPPWMPHFKTNIEEVTVNQEETKSLVTATTTRRKQQQEMIRKALLAEEERKRVGRENFPMTTVPVTSLAAYEPLLHHGENEHEEVAQEEMTLAARRVSLAPTNRANNQSRSMSWRNGSLHWGRLPGEGDEDRLEHGQHLQTAQSVFPSCICAAVLPVLHLLDDHDVNSDGVSVAEVAYKVIWDCIVDDPILFLRHFLEKLTNRDRQEELMFLLRKLILYFPQMPAQAAHSLFNYLIGYIMFYVRTPCEAGQDAISGALSLLWLSIPSVEGIYFKDLKQTLKKEQCDPFLLVSASVASAKKILVHGPDLSSIPSQLFIHEDTQFIQILQESLEFFNIPDDQHSSHFLVDTKTHQIHNSNAYVRDFYFFRRNFYPQLSLVKMNPDDAKLALQRRVFMLKFVEVGKVLLTNAVMESTPVHQLQNHVSFLHEELSKLPSFPRKALEAEFDMYSGGWGKEIFGMDSLHKYSWAKLMSTIFTSMSSTFTWSNDLNLFIHVLNGTIVLQFEDTAILRFCLATLINTSRHFKHIFATNGFLHIMPTLLRVYSNNQPNPVLRNAVQFLCKQFYILHRKPFILQMFGSVAPILDMTCAADGVKDCSKIQPESLFRLLLALEKDCPDHMSVLDLVVGDKPLKALDFCYENDVDTFNMMDVINMCVTVIAYSPDSYRSGQMLTILEMVIPRYLNHLKQETTKKDNSTAARAEVTAINSLAVAVRALRPLDWEAAANILKGVYQTLRKFSFVALLPHLKTLVNILITILLTSSGSGSLLPESLTCPGSHRGEPSGLQTDASPLFVSSVVKLVAMQMQALGTLVNILITILLTSSGSGSLLPESLTCPGSHRGEPSGLQTDASPLFVSSVVKLVAMQMQALGDQYSLEQICGGASAFCANEKSLNLLINFMLPLCIRVGSHCRDTPRLSQADVTFVLTVVTNLLSLEILMVCFDKQLAPQWHQVAKAIRCMASRSKVDLPFWKFLDFLVTHRPSLFILLQTFIQFRMMRVNCDTAQEYYLQQTIRDKLQGYTFSYHKSASAILVTLALELRQLRDELASNLGVYRSRAATSITEHSDYSQTQFHERLPNASITEIAAEIIGPTKASHSSLIKRSSRATLFSQSSSTGSVPPQQQQRSHSQSGPLISTEASPTAAATSAAITAMAALHRSRSSNKSSKRITAREGSRILDKFARKGEDVPDIPVPHSPLLHRQGTIRFRGNLSASKQNSLELEGPLAQVVYENEDAEAGANGSLSVEGSAGLTPGGDDPRDHRLQRQDAKSRKTFKIKRVKTKTSVRPRFMSHRRRPDFHDGGSGAGTGLGGADEHLHLTQTAVVFHERALKNNSGLQRPGVGGMARSVETIPEAAEVKSARLRFLQRSKSHDEPSGESLPHPPGERDRDKSTHSSARTGRIHRKGARIIHSRSPSVSPSVSPRPSYHRRKPKDHTENQNLPTQGGEPGNEKDFQEENAVTVSSSRSSSLRKTVLEKEQSQGNLWSPFTQVEVEHDTSTVTENGLHQRLSAVMSGGQRQFALDHRQSSTEASGSPLTSPVSLEDGNFDNTGDSKTVSDSFVSLSSMDTVVSLVDHARDGRMQCKTSPLSDSPSATPPKSEAVPDTPTRRMAVRFPQGKAPDFRSLSDASSGSGARGAGTSTQFTSSSALEQIKGYRSPSESPMSTPPSSAGLDSSLPPRPGNASRERRQGNAPIQRPQYPSPHTSSVASPTQLPPAPAPALLLQKSTKPPNHTESSRPISPQLSPSSPPPQPSTHSGSSSQTSPSHVTSFSSSPNDSPVRKPSFSSSATSPTRHFSYSSSSTMDSPTHKLFVSYRNSPSHRTGLLTSPTHDLSRKTSFSSSSHGSPVRKPSFSSSSESQPQQNYSSATSSQSSILSSPTHGPGSRGFGGNPSPKDLSPAESPSKGPLGVGARSPAHRSPITSPLASPDRGTARVRYDSGWNRSVVNTSPYRGGTSPYRGGASPHRGGTSPHRANRSPLISPTRETGDVVKYGRPPSPKMDTSTPQHIPKPVASMNKVNDVDVRRPAASQIPRSANQRHASPSKPSTLKLQDQAATDLTSRQDSPGLVKTQPHNTVPGAAPLSSPDPDNLDPPYTRPKVQGLVSRFERRPLNSGGGLADTRGARQGGPQSFTVSPSTGSGSESGTSSPVAPASSKFSPPAYKYTSPLSGSRPNSRFNSQPSPSPRAYPSSLSPLSLQQPLSASPSPVNSLHSCSSQRPGDEQSVSSSVYVTRCDSSDSLSANESSSLLRDEEKSGSLSSLYYADEDIPDAV
ncbi:unc-80-like protein, partial [Plakobranchus ocellatus]